MNTHTPAEHRFSEAQHPDQAPPEPGLYFFTICMDPGGPRLGKISGGSLKPNAVGRAVEAHWRNLPRIFTHVRLETFALMPDHVHGIVAVEEGAPHGLAAILRTFKSVSAREINKRRQTPGHPVWQWGHEEHILHDTAAADKMRDYIACGPVRWHSEHRSPLNPGFCRRGGRILGRILRRPLPIPAFPHKIHAPIRRT
tara:strand:- start:57 stop:650 length:594 start_codon:yes stop_codon:yes gene_type:complete